MNLTETHVLLTWISEAFDNRRFGDETVVAWREILADVALDDARRAVSQHFAESDAYLMPVHVRRGALAFDRERRRIEREHREQLAIEAERSDPTRRDRTEATRELIRQLRDSLPAGDPDKLRRPEVLRWDRERARELRTYEPNPHYRPDATRGGDEWPA